MTDDAMRYEKAKRIAGVLVRWCELLIILTLLGYLSKFIGLINVEHRHFVVFLGIWVISRWLFKEFYKKFENYIEEERWKEEAQRNNNQYEKNRNDYNDGPFGDVM